MRKEYVGPRDVFKEVVHVGKEPPGIGLTDFYSDQKSLINNEPSTAGFPSPPLLRRALNPKTTPWWGTP